MIKNWIDNLSNGVRNDKILVIVGPEASGKSLVTDTIIKMLKIKDIAHYRDDNYFSDQLDSSLIICEEDQIPEVKVMTQNEVRIERKAENPYTIKNRANWVIHSKEEINTPDFLNVTPLEVLATLLNMEQLNNV